MIGKLTGTVDFVGEDHVLDRERVRVLDAHRPNGREPGVREEHLRSGKLGQAAEEDRPEGAGDVRLPLGVNPIGSP